MHDRIIGLYEDNAGAWDALRGRDLVEAGWLGRFIRLLPPGGSVLDVGCGSGEPIARYLIDRGFNLTGVDSSPSLIGLCRKRFPAHEWIAADMRDLALDRRFDGILAWHSLFHLTRADQRKVLPKLAGHLAPGGALLFTSGSEAGEAIGEWQGESLYHASLAPEAYERRLQRSGLSVVDRRLGDPDCGDASVWLAQMRPASGLDGSA